MIMATTGNVEHDRQSEQLARRAEHMWRAAGNRGRFPSSAGGGGRKAGVAGTGYDVAARTRLRPMFRLLSALFAGADRHLDQTSLAYLREMCRAHDRQGSLFSGILNRAVANIVGPNFSLEPATGDRVLDQQVSDVLSPRMEKRQCDAAGLLNLRQYMATGLRAVWNDGEQVAVKTNAGQLVGYEADQIVTPSDATGQADGARIVLGVELDRINRPLAAWIRGRASQGDSGSIDQSLTQTARIPAQYLLRPAYRTRFGQTRGVPFLAAILGMYERLDSYIENESLAAVANAMASWKITHEASADVSAVSAGGDGIDDNPDGDTADTFDKIQRMEPLSVFDLAPGEDVEMVTSNRPGPAFEGYTLLVCRLVGAGIGFPLELLLLDFSKTSFSSARASLNEAQRNFRFWQGFLREEFCDPWWQWQVSRAIAAKQLPADPRCYFYKAAWPAWNYVDPWRESQAQDLRLKMRVTSRQALIRETGRDPEDVYDEIAEDSRQLAARGISSDDAPATPLEQQPPIDENATTETPTDQEALV